MGTFLTSPRGDIIKEFQHLAVFPARLLSSKVFSSTLTLQQNIGAVAFLVDAHEGAHGDRLPIGCSGD